MYVLTATGFSLRLAGVISERDPLDEICRELTSFKLEWDDNYAQLSCCSFLVSFRLEDDNYTDRARDVGLRGDDPHFARPVQC
jgi:hypothetical protein